MPYFSVLDLFHGFICFIEGYMPLSVPLSSDLGVEVWPDLQIWVRKSDQFCRRHWRAPKWEAWLISFSSHNEIKSRYGGTSWKIKNGSRFLLLHILLFRSIYSFFVGSFCWSGSWLTVPLVGLRRHFHSLPGGSSPSNPFVHLLPPLETAWGSMRAPLLDGSTLRSKPGDSQPLKLLGQVSIGWSTSLHNLQRKTVLLCNISYD